ncbi:MAG TPA: MoaD/ThiS family protein [Acidimicrobiia bacterium]|nr:MoaD/ThiS family protein [Acidimicrobiia bacterium]
MSIEVRIPAVMRSNTAGQATAQCTGDTVGTVLDDLIAQFPGIGDVLFGDTKTLHKYVNIYLDADDIRYVGGLDAKIGEAKELTILPAVAGGSE